MKAVRSPVLSERKEVGLPYGPSSNTLPVLLTRGGFTLGRRGHVPPDHVPTQIHLLPQMQKLADPSDMISEVPKCSKVQHFRGIGELTMLPRTPS